MATYVRIFVICTGVCLFLHNFLMYICVCTYVFLCVLWFGMYVCWLYYEKNNIIFSVVLFFVLLEFFGYLKDVN